MSEAKRQVRAKFRTGCLARDKNLCRLCTVHSTPVDKLEIHHITNRNEMPEGGYIKSNGITSCPSHHLEAENGLWTKDELYLIIKENK